MRCRPRNPTPSTTSGQSQRRPARSFKPPWPNFAPHAQAKVATDNQTRGPLLLISGTEDHIVPDVVTRATHKQYRHSTAVTDLKRIEHRGHSLTIDSGWREVADFILLWLTAHSL